MGEQYIGREEMGGWTVNGDRLGGELMDTELVVKQPVVVEVVASEQPVVVEVVASEQPVVVEVVVSEQPVVVEVVASEHAACCLTDEQTDI